MQELMHKYEEWVKSIAFGLVLLIILFYTFRQAAFGNVVMLWITIMYLFFIPGYLIMRPFREKIGFFAQSIVGMAISASIYIITMYLLGLAAIKLQVYAMVMPLVLILIAVSVHYLSCESRPQEKSPSDSKAEPTDTTDAMPKKESSLKNSKTGKSDSNPKKQLEAQSGTESDSEAGSKSSSKNK